MENTENKPSEGVKFACTGCGAYLKYEPGTQLLSCEYCGFENEIIRKDDPIEELDYVEFLNNSASNKTITEHFVTCESCNATSTISDLSSASCPYCSTPLIIKNAFTENVIQPKSLLPFKLDIGHAKDEFKKWLNSRWFAPSDLKKVLSIDNFKGIYLPYWTYDTYTYTSYTGEQGIYYYETEMYTVTENGKSVTQTRQVRKTRWYYVSGNVQVSFDDLLVPATKSLPPAYILQLEPWDMENLVPFDKSYLSGFITEKYQIDLKEGFEVAKNMTEERIREVIRRDIGGDEQRINNKNTSYKNITFKHLLFPVYVSVYKYNNKLYQFLVNARTGEVQGERPYSWIKITFAVLAVIAVIASVIFYFNNYQR